jgi:hypothetical protein
MALDRLFNRLRLLEALHNVAPDLVHPKMATYLESQNRKENPQNEIFSNLKKPINTFFTTDIGYLQQHCTDSFQLYKDHGKLHNRSIKAMAITSDGKTLFTVGYDRH